MSNFNFDLGIGSARPKSLNDQKKNPTSSGYSSYSYSYSSSTTTTSATQPKPSWQPGKPSWTHQPAQTGLTGPTSMVGDIFGKSWGTSAPASGTGIGIMEKNPSLFGDLVTSAMGKGSNKGNTNAPLKNATPAPNKTAYSMGNLADSLPKNGNSAKSPNLGGSNGGFGGYTGGYSASSGSANVGANKGTANLGGPALKSMSGGGIGGGMSGNNKDPFGSLLDFGVKPKSGSSLNSGSKDGKANVGNDAFGEFQNAANSSAASAFPSGGFGASNNDFMGATSGSNSNFDDFGIPNSAFDSQKQKQPASAPAPAQSSAGDPLDMFFTPSSGGAATASGGMGGQQFNEVDDWGLNSDFGGGDVHDAAGGTTELEGLPPPPAGVSASTAKSKGMDNQKQGQYADAIKWLSWAVVLLDKTGDTASTMEVLSCRASCYKEVGEYKKAVADCSKVLEHDDANVSVLVQRALLYESMEKYKLGAEDLRTVLKIDPSNRVARSTVHRLAKMAD
ncbi:hypothetical protein Tsubulata_011698 [Turnera subulata]|uniref:Uncharacterized protein n=1 Tax=Turnera subulata TaxID=218843 RepID=A0A9Q0JL52_9ROSI|nr:hypothetical protein Tsubulata_011698 [Turnera subulata]